MPGHREACDPDRYIPLIGCRPTMCRPPWVLLLLALVLIPDSGVSQSWSQHKDLCRYCKTVTGDISQYLIDGKVNKPQKCSLSDTLRFQLNNKKKEVICVKRHQDWVKKLTDCLDSKEEEKQQCLQRITQAQAVKGSNEKPSTTTVNAPLSSMKPPIQTRVPSIGYSTEPTKPGAATPTPSLVTTRRSDVIRPDSNETNINSRQGDNSSKGPIEVPDGKMKHMQTTIIALILIILVMVAVGVGVYCRKKKKNDFKSPCGGSPIEYMAAPSESSIAEVGA